MKNRYEITPSQWTVREMPEQLRPDAELDRLGADHVAEATLLANILTGTRAVNPVDLGHGLLRIFGGLEGIRLAPVAELARVDGMTERQARSIIAALELGRRWMQEQQQAMPLVRTPEDVARILRPKIRGMTVETVWCLLLSARNHLVSLSEVSRGLLDASLVHPREVFREAVRIGAAAIIVAHNHPSGDATPSANDIRLTRLLVAAGRIVDVRVVDSIVVTTEGLCSLREEGICEFGD